MGGGQGEGGAEGEGVRGVGGRDRDRKSDLRGGG